MNISYSGLYWECNTPLNSRIDIGIDRKLNFPSLGFNLHIQLLWIKIRHRTKVFFLSWKSASVLQQIVVDYNLSTQLINFRKLKHVLSAFACNRDTVVFSAEIPSCRPRHSPAQFFALLTSSFSNAQTAGSGPGSISAPHGARLKLIVIFWVFVISWSDDLWTNGNYHCHDKNLRSVSALSHGRELITASAGKKKSKALLAISDGERDGAGGCKPSWVIMVNGVRLLQALIVEPTAGNNSNEYFSKLRNYGAEKMKT